MRGPDQYGRPIVPTPAANTGGGFSTPASGDSLDAEWGPAQGDVRHRVGASLSLSPFKNVSIGLNARGQSGAAYNVTTGRDDNGDGIVSPSEDGDYLTWEDPAQVRRYLGGPNSNNPALFFSTRDDGSTDYKTGANLTYRLARPVFLYEDYTHRTLNVRGTLNAQIHPQHQLSLGGDIRRHWIKKLQRSTNQLMYASSPFFYEEWSRSPLEFSGFVQDRFESGGLIATIGLRLDAFNFNAANLRDYFAPIQVVTDATGLTAQRPVRGSNVPFKIYVSPRLGISHPVSDRAVLYFSLARTVSPPPYSILYYNYSSWLASATNVTSRIDQEPLIATSYDIGGQIRVLEGFTGSLGLFYRDMENYSLTYMQPVVTGAYYLVSARAGSAATHGAELTLDYRPERTGMANGLWARLAYTYSVFNLARTLYRNQWQYTSQQSSAIGTPGQLPFGNMQSWDRTYGRDYSGQSTMLSGFDRTHRFTLLLTLPLPYGFRLGCIGTFNSGFFYPEIYDGNESPTTYTAYGYNESPWNKRVDLRLEKSIDLPGLGRLNVFADMINAFDWRNVLTYCSFNDMTFKAWALKGDPTGGPGVNQPVTMEGSLIYGVPREFYFGVNLTF